MHTSAAPTADLLANLRRAAATKPDERWLSFVDDAGAVDWTYAEMLGRIAVCSAAFDAHGVQAGDVVFILSGSSVEAVAAYLGAMAHGAIPSFMPPLSPRQEPALYWTAQAALIDHVRPRLVLAQGRTLAAGRDKLVCPLLDLDQFSSPEVPATMPHNRPAHPIAFLQHTSGTTALKKGVLISHEAAIAQLQRYADRLGLRDSDVIVSWLPLYHDMGLVACLMLALHFCKPLVLIDPFAWVMRPLMLLEWIARRRGSLSWLPNFAFKHMARVADDRRHDLSSLRMLINCSEPCRPESMESFVRAFSASGITAGHIKTCYAMAETVFAVSQPHADESVSTIEVQREAFEQRGEILRGPGLRFASCGPALADVSVRVLDDAGEALPPGRVGQIALAAPFLFTGYNRLPDVTAARLRNGWYHSGDRGFVHEGELYVIGRFDDVVIVNGKKVDAAEVEHALTRVAGIHAGRAVAFAVWNEQLGSHELAVVYEGEHEGTDAAAAEASTRRSVREAVHGAVAIYPAVVAARRPGWIVKSTSGKISRSSNRLKYLQEASHE